MSQQCQSRSTPNIFSRIGNPKRPLPPNTRKMQHFIQRPLPPTKPSPKIKPLPNVPHPTANIITKSKSAQLPYLSISSASKSVFNRHPPPNKSMQKTSSHPLSTLPSLKLQTVTQSKPKRQYRSKIVFIDPLIDDKNLRKQPKFPLKSSSIGCIHEQYNVSSIDTAYNPSNDSKPKPKLTPKSPPRARSHSFHIKKFGDKQKDKGKKKRKRHRKLKTRYDPQDDKKYDEAHFAETEDCEFHWVRRDLIGVGSFGKVYKGYDKNTGEMCAIKQIPFDPNSLSMKKHETNKGSKSRLSLIKREVNIMKQLKHENIVEFYSYECSVKYRTLCIIMEFVDGQSIDSMYNKNGAFTEDDIRKYTRQLMSGLQFAHKRKIIHRDIKGKNILISNHGKIKIADFGSAKLCDTTFGQSHKLEPSMDYQYTPLWTAPEVLISLGYNDKVDIWSVGCVCIEMATANKPWNECQFESVFAALYHIGQPDNYPQYPSTLSKQCKDFIKLCLNRDANKRCSAQELLRHEFLDLNH